MFTSLALIALGFVGWVSQRENRHENRKSVDTDIVLQTRQEIPPWAYLLAAILIMLGERAVRITPKKSRQTTPSALVIVTGCCQSDNEIDRIFQR